MIFIIFSPSFARQLFENILNLEKAIFAGIDMLIKIYRRLIQHNPLSATEWRSFVITWDFVTRNISVYDTKSVIMTYVDTDATESERLYINYHAFIRSPAAMLLRFHICEYKHARNDHLPRMTTKCEFKHNIYNKYNNITI